MGGVDLDDGAVGLGKDQRANAGKGTLSLLYAAGQKYSIVSAAATVCTKQQLPVIA